MLWATLVDKQMRDTDIELEKTRREVASFLRDFVEALVESDETAA